MNSPVTSMIIKLRAQHLYQEQMTRTSLEQLSAEQMLHIRSKYRWSKCRIFGASVAGAIVGGANVVSSEHLSAEQLSAEQVSPEQMSAEQMSPEQMSRSICRIFGAIVGEAFVMEPLNGDNFSGYNLLIHTPLHTFLCTPNNVQGTRICSFQNLFERN